MLRANPISIFYMVFATICNQPHPIQSFSLPAKNERLKPSRSQAISSLFGTRPFQEFFLTHPFALRCLHSHPFTPLPRYWRRQWTSSAFALIYLRASPTNSHDIRHIQNISYLFTSSQWTSFNARPKTRLHFLRKTNVSRLPDTRKQVSARQEL